VGRSARCKLLTIEGAGRNGVLRKKIDDLRRGSLVTQMSSAREVANYKRSHKLFLPVRFHLN